MLCGEIIFATLVVIDGIDPAFFWKMGSFNVSARRMRQVGWRRYEAHALVATLVAALYF
jgi:hypothetical protein